MQTTDFIRPESIISGLPTRSKTALLQALAKIAAEALGLPEGAILDALSKRESLGSTGMGGGVAIPHAPLPGLATPFGLLARLERPIAYEAIDGEPVDIVCLILTPADAGKDHINALACVARRLRSLDIPDRIRAAKTSEALYAALVEV